MGQGNKKRNINQTEGSFNKWRRKKGEANTKSQLTTYKARLEKLLKIKNPNDWQKNQIANARKLIKEASKSSGKSEVTNNQTTSNPPTKYGPHVRGQQKKDQAEKEKLKVKKLKTIAF